jgi:uncharacterized protein
MGNIKTPCIGVCSTGIGDNVCRGCKRFAHEVIQWNAYTESERDFILLRINNLLAQVVQHYIVIVDEAKMTQQITQQQLKISVDLDRYCQAYELIRSFGSQLKNLEWIGCRAQGEWRDKSVADLKKILDDSFFKLSCAHYERYFLVAQ